LSAQRSWLYVPGDREGWLAKAQRSEADVVIADLEDAVAPNRKEAALALVVGAIAEQAPGAAPLWVRVDPSRLTDSRAVVDAGAAGIVLPKSSAALVREVDALLARASRQVPLVPLVEDAVGLAELDAVATHARVLRFGMGEADLCADLGLLPGPDRSELAPYRAQVVAASARAGKQPPIGSTSTELRDLDSVRATTRALLRQGFRARTAVHPAQVRVINEVLTPTDEQVQQAREVLAAGSGAVGVNGRLVDEAVARSAREVLARAGEAGQP
jgi:citrate lyase subunit beta/citryl-CoA lyase